MLLLLSVGCQGLRPWILYADEPAAPPTAPPAGPAAPARPHPDVVTMTPSGPISPPRPDEEVDPCTLDAVEPGRPAPPHAVEVLTVTVRTGDGGSDGTTDETVELCLGAHCFPLAQSPDGPLAAGAIGVWSFEGLSIPRAELGAVELRMGDGDDHWGPAAIDLRFDGEPVHCAPLALEMGSGSGELERWSDPLGLHQACTSAWERTLTHGPAVAVGPDAARILVRTDATRPVSLRAWPTADPAAARIAGWAWPLAGDDFAARVSLDCLEPGTAYSYEVLVDGLPQAAGAFTTPPPDGEPGVFELAFGSGADEAHQPIFTALQGHAPDLFAFVGDAHPGEAVDLDGLRSRRRRSLLDRGAFLAGTPTLSTWDDLDFLGPRSDGYTPGRETALRAFAEYTTNPAAGTATTPGTFFLARWGDVDLFFLDGRYHRWREGDLLGAAQRAWLVGELRLSTATFKLLIGGSQWTLEGDPTHGFAGSPGERDELFEEIADIPGVLLLSGDAGRGELRELAAPAYPLPEITSSPLAGEASGCDGSDELLACVSEEVWATLRFDTTLADPEVTATLNAADGAARATQTWRLSQLTP